MNEWTQILPATFERLYGKYLQLAGGGGPMSIGKPIKATRVGVGIIGKKAYLIVSNKLTGTPN